MEIIRSCVNGGNMGMLVHPPEHTPYSPPPQLSREKTKEPPKDKVVKVPIVTST